MPSAGWEFQTVTVTSPVPTAGVGGAGHGTIGVELFAVDSTGALVGALSPVTVGDLQEAASSTSTFQFDLAADDTVGLDRVVPWESEVQLYVDGVLRFWGVPTVWSGKAGGAVVQVGCADVSVWASRRLASIAEIDDVRNGDFDAGFDYWGHTSVTLDTSRYRSAPQSAKLSSRSQFISQSIGQQGPSTMNITAWVWVESATAFSSPPLLFVSILPRADGRGAQDVRVEVPDDLPRDQWVQIGIEVTVPDGMWWGVLWVYGGDGGDVWVDDISSTQAGIAAWVHAFDTWSGSMPGSDSSAFMVRMLTWALDGLGFGIVAAHTGVRLDGGLSWWDKCASEVLDVAVRMGIHWRLDVTPTSRTLRFGTPDDDLSVTHPITLSAGGSVGSTWSTGGGRVTRALVFGPAGHAVLISDDTTEPPTGPVDEVVQAPSGTAMRDLASVGLRWLRESPASTVAVRVTGVDAATVTGVRPRDRLNVSADLAGPGGAGEYMVVTRTSRFGSGLVDLDLVVAP